MNRLMHLLARIAIRAPAVTLGVLLAATIMLGAAAGDLEVDTGVEGFAPEGGIADTLGEIGDRFEATSSVQVLLDAGPGGDVLERDVLVEVDRLAQALQDDPVIAAVLAPERTGREPVATFALPFVSAAESQDQTLAELDATSARLLIEGVLDAALDQIEPLFSDDLELSPPRARSGLVSVAFDTGTDSADRAAASRRVAALVDEAQLNGLRSSVLSITAIEDGIEAALERDLPVLLGTSLLLVLLVLAWLFRSLADVVVGFLGLLASIVWMIGFAALLGPGGLGVLGAFNQIGIAIPVLLVGLGIDYSVHLTTRYREQRARGDDPDRAAYVTLVTVGVALILATIASVAGFLANVATPLPPIRDFGILAAIGIVAAFLILGGAVPATRTLIDRRLDRRATLRADAETIPATPAELNAPPDAPSPPPVAATSTARHDPRWVRATATLATRHATPALAAAALIVAISSVVASGLDTEFNERDFLPEGDPIVATLDRLDAQFGGDVGERTYVLVDGDTGDPALLAAAAELTPRLVEVEGVRLVGDRPEVVSPFELVERYAELGEQVRDSLAADLEAWDDPVAAAAEVDLPDPIDPDLVDDEDVELPADLEAALRARLPDGRSPLAALVATGDPDELEASVRETIAASIAEERPASLSAADLSALAALPTTQLNLAVLAQRGLPDEVLSDDDRELLSILDDLEAAGYDPAAGPDAVARDAWPDLLAVLARHAPDALADVLDDQGLIMIVSSSAGPDGADRLAADLETAAEPIAAAGTGAEVAVVSDPLVQAEIISSLSAAQLLAILISLASAAVLLVGATILTSRSVGLGLIGIVPSVVALSLVLGTMRLIGLSFNALTATVASIAVGIGVPYGIHLINRFREARSRGMLAEAAIGDSLRNTGPALIGSAVTTGLAFAVLTLSESTPVVQFGQVSTLMIGYALLACLLVQPALLVLWGRRRDVLGR